jgi:hypothetical protein
VKIPLLRALLMQFEKAGRFIPDLIIDRVVKSREEE